MATGSGVRRDGDPRAVGTARVRAATAVTGAAALAAAAGIAWGVAPHTAAAGEDVDVVVVEQVPVTPPATADDPAPQPTRVVRKHVVKRRVRSAPPIATSGAS